MLGLVQGKLSASHHYRHHPHQCLAPQRERECERARSHSDTEQGMEEENEEMKSAWHHLHSSFIGVGGGCFLA